jgi:hypothetical protein
LQNLPPAYAKIWEQGPIRPNPKLALAQLARTKQVIQIPDIKAESAYAEGDPLRVATVELGGREHYSPFPCLRKISSSVRSLSTVRKSARLPTSRLRWFRILPIRRFENTRLLNELRESLQQQTATSEVLKVISSSPGDLQPVFQAMLENATRICEAKFGTLFRFDGKNFHTVAQFNTPAALLEAQTRRGPFEPTPGTPIDHVMRTKQVIHSADDAAEPVPNCIHIRKA